MTIVATTAAVDERGSVTVAVPKAFRGPGRQVRVVLSTDEPSPTAVTQAEWVAILDRAAAASDWSTLARPEQPPARPRAEIRPTFL